ncbi:MAG: glycosyltransferase family 2 protein [Deltaproteobacteria bacterium]|nr:glycosyltransferase family 2 protein [Deltaproteobacteria bacterium]
MPGAEDQATETARLISFVLPVYNERGNLEELHRRICDAMQTRSEPFELVFVDDGSTDGSFEVLRSLHAADSRVRVLQLRRNFGKSAAYSAGFAHARGDVIVTMDTDLQDDPADLGALLSRLYAGCDLVSGWKHGGKGPGKTRASHFFNRVVAAFTRIPLHDFNCPFRAFRRQVAEEIEIRGELYRYIPVLAHARGFELAEVKIGNQPRGYGRSKYGRERFLRGFLDLLTVVFITRFSRRPLHLMGLGGILSLLAGFGLLLFFTAAHVLHLAGVLADEAWNIHDRPAISLGILLIIVGVQFFSLGLLAELLVTSSGSGSAAYSIKRVLPADRAADAPPPEAD